MLIGFYRFPSADTDDPFVSYYWDHAPRKGDAVWLPPNPDGNKRVTLERFEVRHIEWSPHNDNVAASIEVMLWSTAEEE